jgi:hypothetical protein
MKDQDEAEALINAGATWATEDDLEVVPCDKKITTDSLEEVRTCMTKPTRDDRRIRHEEREHVKQTLLIKLSPYLTDEQSAKLVEILKGL